MSDQDDLIELPTGTVGGGYSIGIGGITGTPINGAILTSTQSGHMWQTLTSPGVFVDEVASQYTRHENNEITILPGGYNKFNMLIITDEQGKEISLKVPNCRIDLRWKEPEPQLTPEELYSRAMSLIGK